MTDTSRPRSCAEAAGASATRPSAASARLGDRIAHHLQLGDPEEAVGGIGNGLVIVNLTSVVLTGSNVMLDGWLVAVAYSAFRFFTGANRLPSQ